MAVESLLEVTEETKGFSRPQKTGRYVGTLRQIGKNTLRGLESYTIKTNARYFKLGRELTVKRVELIPVEQKSTSSSSAIYWNKTTTYIGTLKEFCSMGSIEEGDVLVELTDERVPKLTISTNKGSSKTKDTEPVMEAPPKKRRGRPRKNVAK